LGGWEDAEDHLAALLECELRERGWSAAGAWLEALTEEVRVVSCGRACRHGRMDVIRAELVCRGAQAMPAEEPARVFSGGPAEGGGP
jgi:hypothetical protein